MGDYADDILFGRVCQSCGVWLHSADTGYPRSCHDCKRDEIKKAPREKKTNKTKKGGRK